MFWNCFKFHRQSHRSKFTFNHVNAKILRVTPTVTFYLHLASSLAFYLANLLAYVLTLVFYGISSWKCLRPGTPRSHQTLAICSKIKFTRPDVDKLRFMARSFATALSLRRQPDLSLKNPSIRRILPIRTSKTPSLTTFTKALLKDLDLIHGFIRPARRVLENLLFGQGCNNSVPRRALTFGHNFGQQQQQPQPQPTTTNNKKKKNNQYNQNKQPTTKRKKTTKTNKTNKTNDQEPKQRKQRKQPKQSKQPERRKQNNDTYKMNSLLNH